jgi:hypothetical protein
MQMLHECPNCREGVGYFRVFRTAGWGTFRCKACGSVLGISLLRRLVAVAVWIVAFLFLMEFLGLHAWGRLYTYSFMVVSLFAAMYVGDRVVLVERRAFTCKRCGYNLQGLPVPRCPECGMGFEPAERERILSRVQAPAPRRRHWWVALCALVLMLAGVIGGVVAWYRAGQLPTGAVWIGLVAGALGLAALGAAVVVLRRGPKATKR